MECKGNPFYKTNKKNTILFMSKVLCLGNAAMGIIGLPGMKQQKLFIPGQKRSRLGLNNL